MCRHNKHEVLSAYCSPEKLQWYDMNFNDKLHSQGHNFPVEDLIINPKDYPGGQFRGHSRDLSSPTG
jgi:hypothetical protein